MKIGRNDLCLCGSGKKYKKCCLGVNPGKGVVEYQTFPEKFVINRILEGSPKFKKYWEAEISNIEKNILWTDNRHISQIYRLGSGINAKCIHSNDSQIYVILLKKIPPKIEDDIIIAHELGHIILSKKGFPKVKLKDETEELRMIAGTLNSIFEDPLVETLLFEYKFDIYTKTTEEIKNDIQILNKEDSHPKNIRVEILYTLNYLSKILDENLLLKLYSKEVRLFENYFDEKFPDIAKKGMELYNIIKGIGYDTPDKQLELFKLIIKRYDLSQYLFVE